MNHVLLFRGIVTDEYAKGHPLLRPGDWVVGGVYIQGDNVFVICDGDEFVPVKPDTVGQYTGCEDSNDTRIFEGDILRFRYDIWDGDGYDDSTLEAIVFGGGGGYFVCNPYLDYLQDVPLYDVVEYGSDITIIGNMFDNPEIFSNIEPVYPFRIRRCDSSTVSPGDLWRKRK